MIQVYFIGKQLDDQRIIPLLAIGHADLVVVYDKKEKLFDRCNQIPETNKPIIFISNFTLSEIRQLENLDIRAMTIDNFNEYLDALEKPKVDVKLSVPQPMHEAKAELSEKKTENNYLPVSAGRNGRIITVGSNKGGVGKTFISTNLAVYIALAEPNKKVVLVEYDREKNDIVLSLHLIKRPELTVLNWQKSINYECERHPVIKNLFLLPYGEQEMLGPGTMKEPYGQNILQSLKRDYDYVIVDLGIFSDLWCINSAFKLADTLILLADESRYCLSRLISFLSRKEINMEKHLIINRVTGRNYYKPNDIARALGFDNRYIIPEDGEVQWAEKKNKFVVLTQTIAGDVLRDAFSQIFSLKPPSKIKRVLNWLLTIFKKRKVS